MDPIRASYVKGFTALSLWYVCKAMREGNEPFADVVNRRVNIYRNTSFYDGRRHPATEDVGAEWAGVLERLEALYEQHRGEPSTARFEAAGLDLLWPCLEARLRRVPEGPKADRPYGCWTFDYRREDRLSLHIANVYSPKSPLSEMILPFAASLVRLLRDSRAQRPEVAVVRCGSWLNSAPPFLALFPDSWAEGAVANPDIRFTMGHWGQFTDRRGDFHRRNGERFRATGKLPYPCSTCECPIEEALDHLAARFPEAVRYSEEVNAGL